MHVEESSRIASKEIIEENIISMFRIERYVEEYLGRKADQNQLDLEGEA